MDLGTLTEQQYFELMQKLEGTGYSKEEDSVRVGELRAWARMAFMATIGLNDTVANLFLQSATSSLDLRERTQYLVQGSTLSTASRRARLIAYQQGAWLVEARLSLALGTYLADFTGTTQAPADTEALAHRSAPSAGLLVARKEPAATTKQQLRDLAAVIERGLPARAVAGGVYQRDATYGDALAPAGIKLTPAVTVSAQTKARTAPVEVLPSSSVEQSQWLEIQAMLCQKSVGFSVDQAKQGRWVMYGEASLAAGGTALIDGPTANSSVDWQNRFVSAHGVIGNASISDPTQSPNTEHVWLPPSKMGPASGPYTHAIFDTQAVAVTTGVTLTVDASGNLKITNTTGGTKYVTLMIHSSATYTPSSTADTQPWMDASQVEHADLAEMYAAQTITDGVVGEFHGVDAGALRRVIYSGALYYQAGNGIPQRVILDSSEDWRNRWVLVANISNRNGHAAPPTLFPLPGTLGMIAQPTSGQAPAPSAPLLFYTGPGAVAGSPTADAYQQPLHTAFSATSAPCIWLFADTDGNLVCEMKDGLSDFEAASMLGLVVATERTDGSSVVTPVPVHATQVQTIDLEQPQNCGTYQQGRQGNVPRYLLTDPAPKAIPTCPPLGAICEGSIPRRPVSFMVRERLGALDDGKYEARQPITGQRRRMVSIKAPALTVTPLDEFNVPTHIFPIGVVDQMDFRDRLIWCEGRCSASDITVGKAAPASDSAGTPFLAILYSGPQTFPVANPITSFGQYTCRIATGVYIQFEFSRGIGIAGFHSRLVIANTSVSDIYVNMAIEASGFLGLTDRRIVGQAF